MFMLDTHFVGWWYWLVSACLLTAGVSGWGKGFLCTIALTLVQTIHFAWRERSAVTFPLQVRLAYMLLLLCALPTPMQWLYWLPLIGTWTQVLFGYCPMARLVSLLPWHRRQALSFALLKRTFLSRPTRGCLLQKPPRHC